MKKLTVLLFLFLVLSGCALHAEPYIMYSDKSHPLDDTSVFAVAVKGEPYEVTIASVDGKSHTPKGAGGGLWVRVLPGEHSFGLKYKSKRDGQLSSIQYELKVEMEPRRVYVVFQEVKPDEAQVSFMVKVLPENQIYTLGLALEGVNYQEFPAKFE